MAGHGDGVDRELPVGGAPKEGASGVGAFVPEFTTPVRGHGVRIAGGATPRCNVAVSGGAAGSGVTGNASGGGSASGLGGVAGGAAAGYPAGAATGSSRAGQPSFVHVGAQRSRQHDSSRADQRLSFGSGNSQDGAIGSGRPAATRVAGRSEVAGDSELAAALSLHLDRRGPDPFGGDWAYLEISRSPKREPKDGSGVAAAGGFGAHIEAQIGFQSAGTLQALFGSVAKSTAPDGVSCQQPAQVGVPNINEPAPVNMLELLGSGTVFLKAFDRDFLDFLDLPVGVRDGPIGQIGPFVRLRGESTDTVDVWAEVRGGFVRLSNGWESFAAAERIVRGDNGLFVLVDTNLIEMRLFGANGIYKPMAARPAIWTAAVAYGGAGNEHASPESAQHGQPYGGGMPVDGMEYEYCQRTFLTPVLIRAFADVWLNNANTFPMYAATMNRTHIITGGEFYFSKTYSNMFVDAPISVRIFFRGEGVFFPGTMRKRLSNGLSRITRGWSRFVRNKQITVGQVLIFSLVGTAAGPLDIRVFPVNNA